jgi:hypothetical protein
VSTPPENDRTPPDGSNGGAGGISAIRASIVVVAFVVTTVLLLGVIHPAATKSATASAPSTSTSTSPPTHPTTTTSTAPVSKASVLVANASGVTGAAATVTNRLQTGGWTLLPPVNASTKVTSSHVYYLAGQQHAADAVAASLHLPTSAVAPYTTAAPITAIGSAEVVVVVGPDLASASTPTTAATTPTTVARTPTTVARTATTARSTTSSTVN